jgi:hypothetical protein
MWKPIDSIAADLQSQLSQFSDSYAFFATSEPDDGERRHWYRWQMIETARKLDYYANTRDYCAWARLSLRTEIKSSVLVSFTGIGHEFRGLIGVSICFFRREEVDSGQAIAADLTPASDELFQINYKEPEESVLTRFDHWLDRSIVRALEIWRQTL